MRRRRRRSQGTWLPVIGTTPNEENGRAPIELSFDVGSLNFQETIWGVVPLTYDAPQEGVHLEPSTDTLAEVLGTEYFLKRIVGKCHVYLDYAVGSNENYGIAIFCMAGFFVARANPQDSGLGDAVPIGMSAGPDTANYNSYNPEALSTIREPWIWRRSWILGNNYDAAYGEGIAYANANQGGFPTAGLATSVQGGNYPPNNQIGRALGDGPHIDAKTKRRVHQDDRLYFAFSARKYTSSVQAPTQDIVHVILDYRLFADLRKARNTGTF